MCGAQIPLRHVRDTFWEIHLSAVDVLNILNVIRMRAAAMRFLSTSTYV